MRRLLPIAFLAFLASSLVFVGCDSGDSGTPDPDRIVGTWTATNANISVNSGTVLGTVDVPVAFASGDGDIVITFRDDNTFMLRVTGPISADFFGQSTDIVEDGFDETTTGTYSIQNDGQIRLGSEADVDYEFNGDDAFDLSVENTDEGRAALAFLLGDSIDPKLLNRIEGASITFRRDS